MGGYGVAIPLEVAPELIDEASGRPSLPVGKRVQNGVWASLTAFLQTRFPAQSRWAASQTIFDYLDVVRDNGVNVRRYQDTWMLDLFFSGCAGNAQVASEAATHWARAWLATGMAELNASVLAPRGLRTLGPPEPEREPPVFVPSGAFGYARLIPASESFPEHAELDAEDRLREMMATDDDLESDEDPPRLAFMGELTVRARELTGGTTCLCQLCAPRFDPDRVLLGLHVPHRE
jgi:hypothetical protein